MKKLYLSRFAHFIYKKEKDEIVALYHAIKMTVIFIGCDVADNLKKFSDGKYAKELFNELDPDVVSEYHQMINKLIRLGFLIYDHQSDERLLKTVTEDIPKPYPHILYLMMADGCNLACNYCFESMNQGEKHEAKKMSFEVIDKSLDLYASLISKNENLFKREKTIIFYGGEPMLNFDGIVFALKRIKEMQKQKQFPKKTKLVLITNGTLIDSQKAEILKRYKVNVSISLDGNKKHNQNRVFPDGRQAFEEIMRGYKNCQKLGLQTSISCTISETNVQEVESVVSEILKNDIKFLGFNVLLGKTSEDYQKDAAKFILDAFQTFKEKGIFEDRMYRKLESFCQRKIMLFDCAAAGGNQLVISPEGSIGVCHGFFKERKYFVESVFNSNINPLENKVWVEWNKRTPFNISQCLDCPAISVCGGGCLMNAEKEYGSIWDIDKRYCEHSQQSLEWLIWDLYESIDKP
jgi:uncharacterized protein